MSSSAVKTVKTGRYFVLGLASETDVVPSASAWNNKNKAGGEKNAPQAEPPKPKQKQQPQQGTKKDTNTPAPLREWTDELEKDYERILSVGEECISEDELKRLLLVKGRGLPAGTTTGFNLYDGFEPSGRMHIAQGVFKAMNVNKCTVDGTNATFVFWVADWFALMNDKMGGDLEKIQTVGHYLIEVWKAAGMNLQHVVFKWCSDEITNNAATYWPTLLDVARRFNVTRIKKCCQIMGRLEGSLTAAQILYPLMQCTDVFFLNADICQLGVDQRKVNMLAREYCDAAGRKHKPIILSHHMLYGLKAGQEKMSKSDPDSAIFMEDTAEDVERKILLAYCPSVEPEEEAEAASASASDDAALEPEDAGKASMQLNEDRLKNPCLDYIQNIIFSPPGSTFTAGSGTFLDFCSLRSAFLSGELTEDELKQGLITSLNRLLEPVRAHFSNNARAKELLAKVQSYKKESLQQQPTEKVVRRLNLVQLKKVPPGSHLVFAPMPTANPSLQEAVDVLAQLRVVAGQQRPCVLYLSDWSARVCSACDADVKTISAYYTVLVTSLKALDPVLMQNVQVLLQSEAILLDPSNYWISVINVGRHFMLDEVMGASMKDSQAVGIVIARLMRVADVAGVEPASLALLADDKEGVGALEQSLVSKFFAAKLEGVIAVPEITLKSGTAIRLQVERESEALKTENDEFFLMDDPKVHGKSKMKKAFCEPGNIAFCPPIALASVFAIATHNDNDSSSLLVQRSAENGGDRDYRQTTDLEQEFENGSLHPGDLKAAVTTVMVRVLEQLSTALNNKVDKDVTKATKDLKAFSKKMAKMKK